MKYPNIVSLNIQTPQGNYVICPERFIKFDALIELVCNFYPSASSVVMTVMLTDRPTNHLVVKPELE